VTAPALPAGEARASGRRARAWAAVGAATVTAIVVIALTHASPRTPPRASAPPNPDSLIAGATLQNARCSNWLAASAADKGLAIRALEASVGAPTEYKGVRGTALSTAEGYQLLDNACANPIARHFLLYELYIRAAAFRSLLASGV
jgi:hypothetical protein